MIDILNVTMAYDAEPVVNDVSLSLPDTGITALIGPNGAGKSTLLSGVGRLQPLAAGEIRIDGRALADWDTEELARTVAILRQENHLAIRLTVAELVMLGRHPHSKGRRTREDYAHAADALNCVDMAAYADRFIDELSGGQRQRAFIAMALAQDTKYLLLDEPLSALDMRHARDMMRHLRRVCDERGISVVIVIHDVNTAAAYADTMVAMKDGRIARVGAPGVVMREEILGEIFGVDVDVARMGERLVAMPVA
ncbi:iron ABC transporter ATP-binding protein [Trueperella pecoris]|uniref:ATP-binding cassette domain-containing protein n=1 Tax=Trueperella pecoris TaxID=2733571 RepID=A0A7M1QV16_9ACTO|nr:ATP-binding cassette domain-containing protein [Trueperella pecoris]QOQ39596.1 ATP-binding cassette domain-containing protein [Trueperella pecoris]QOR45778.1 ATP-binding cassette domain-containing protein [Trueperella pecoris]